MKPGQQLPDPAWARGLVEGDPTQARALAEKVKEIETAFGTDAGADLRAEMRRIAGRALLKKVERENPHWDGRTKVIG